MEVEGERTEIDSERVNGRPVTNGGKLQWLVVSICVISWLVGYSAGTLLSSFYFQRGAHTQLLRWVLLCIGLPIPSLPLLLDRQRISSIVTVGYGFLIGLFGAMAVRVSLFYGGMGFLFAASMFCTEFCASFLLALGITPCPFNSIILLLSRAARSGLWSSGERRGVSRGHFILGSVFTISGFAFSLADRAFQEIVAEESLVVTAMSLSFMLMITVTVCMMGLIINGDLGHQRPEYNHFRLDQLGYWVITLVCSTVAWQTFFLGFIGLVFLAYSLFFEM